MKSKWPTLTSTEAGLQIAVLERQPDYRVSKMPIEAASSWPELPYAAWKDTCATLHLWTAGERPGAYHAAHVNKRAAFPG